MQPYLKLFSGTMSSFSLMLIIGVSVSFLIMVFRENRKPLDFPKLLLAVGFVMPFLFIGGKLLFAAVSVLNGQTLSLNMFVAGGFVFYGGLIGGLLGLCVYAKITKRRVTAYTDVLVPYLALCQAFGRIGCLLNGCCYGMFADTVISVRYPTEHLTHGEPCLPVPIFESVGCLTIAFILFFRRVEHPTAMYLIVYPIMRFGIEFTRGDIIRGVWRGISASQIISAIMLIAGFIVLGYCRKQRAARNMERA